MLAEVDAGALRQPHLAAGFHRAGLPAGHLGHRGAVGRVQVDRPHAGLVAPQQQMRLGQQGVLQRVRDGVGVAVPPGVPAGFTDPVADPLGELLGRFARTRGPFCTAEAAARFGLGLRVAADVLSRLAVDGKLVRGEFTDAPTDSPGAEQWCDAGVLRVVLVQVIRGTIDACAQALRKISEQPELMLRGTSSNSLRVTTFLLSSRKTEFLWKTAVSSSSRRKRTSKLS